MHAKKMCNMQTPHYFLMNNLEFFALKMKKKNFFIKKREKTDIDDFLVRLNLKNNHIKSFLEF